MNVRVGDIVLTPEGNAAFGNRPALIVARGCVKDGLQVHTGTYLLDYLYTDLRFIARITLEHEYGIGSSGKRFRRCRVWQHDGAVVTMDVETRAGKGEPQETRALEIRRLAFAEWLRRREEGAE